MKRSVINLCFITVIMFIFFLFTGCGKMNDNYTSFEKDNSKTTGVNSSLELPPQPDAPKTDDIGLHEENRSKAPGEVSGSTETMNNEVSGGTPPPTEDKIESKNAVVEKVPSKIIKTADIRFQVKKYDESRNKILALVKQSEAYIQSENQTNYNTSIENIIVIRVKSDGFDKLVDQLILESIYTDSKKIVADDVTEQFVDIQARLKSKKEVEIQYLELLKKAKTIYEILQVQQYIRTIREEIDSFEGRLKYMNDRSAYSTINLTFYEKIPVTYAPSPEKSFLNRVNKAFSGGWDALLTFFVVIIALWPLWLIAGLTLFIVIRIIRRRRRNKKTT